MNKFLYHGSGVSISSKYLIPGMPSDKSQKENYLLGVYAADRKDIAIGMSLTTEKYTKSFGDYSKKHFKAIFVRGKPKQKYVYLYKLSSSGFFEKPKGSHQFISDKKVEILEKQKFLVSELNDYWRIATKREKEWYYSIKKK